MSINLSNFHANVVTGAMRTPNQEGQACFLNLPREIRQEILLLSFDDPGLKDVHFKFLLASLDHALVTEGNWRNAPHVLPHTYDWACTL